MVPHTHWDREWYLPFSVYRQRLVALLDSLLVALDREPGLKFHLDGQMAIVDDYLELRPDRLPEIRRAAAGGRISLGPWYTLPDEHLVSGEALLRNLEMGLKRAREIGDPLLVGYLPDQFGHTAQMPQLLRREGIESAVVWRGVPAALETGHFRWEALDGSAVDTVHLQRGYGHGVRLPLEPGALAARIAEETWAPEGPWLVMAGDDHQPVPAGLAAALGEAGGGRPAEVSTIRAFVDAIPAPRETHRGELHSAASSYILKGTLSSRFPLKLRHAALERRVERYVEPAWTLSGRSWPERELRYIWRQIILNSAHDSICGCSIDQVHEQADERLTRAERMAEVLWQRLGQGKGMFNPSPFERQGVPGLGVGHVEPPKRRPAEIGELLLEDGPDEGDEYTHDSRGDSSVRLHPLGSSAKAWQADGEAFTRLAITIDNQTPDHRVRLVIGADSGDGAWAGVAFGAVHRPPRLAGTEAGLEYDLRTDPARGWVLSGRTAVLLAGPFEYELTSDTLCITLLRSVGWLSREDLGNRPGHAGPGIATPGAQMLGRHTIELAIATDVEGWKEAARMAEEYAHPLVPACAEMGHPPPVDDMLSALRRVGGRAQLRTYDLDTFRIADRWLD